MPMEVPKAAKVYTTAYDSFRGVDYTNDSTNVWRHRSPDGLNMLPDESGRPFKRTGWEIMVTEDEIKALVGEFYKINKCHYFELGGIDHIVIFCDVGVLLYAEGNLSLLTTDATCCQSYHRAFFFEGNGKSAFYIYGGYRMWEYDGTSFFECNDIYVPRILISTDPSTCAGTILEAYNVLGNKAKVDYVSNDMFHYFATGDFVININKATFLTQQSTRDEYIFTYDGANWKYNGTGISLSTYGMSIVAGTPSSGDKIYVEYIYGVLLPNNVASGQVGEVEVYVTDATQFDRELTVSVNTTPTAGTCVLHPDEDSMPESSRRAWIEFASADVMTDDGGEDKVEVALPIREVTITNHNNIQNDGSADEY